MNRSSDIRGTNQTEDDIVDTLAKVDKDPRYHCRTAGPSTSGVVDIPHPGTRSGWENEKPDGYSPFVLIYPCLTPSIRACVAEGPVAIRRLVLAYIRSR